MARQDLEKILEKTTSEHRELVLALEQKISLQSQSIEEISKSLNDERSAKEKANAELTLRDPERAKLMGSLQ